MKSKIYRRGESRKYLLSRFVCFSRKPFSFQTQHKPQCYRRALDVVYRLCTVNIVVWTNRTHTDTRNVLHPRLFWSNRPLSNCQNDVSKCFAFTVNVNRFLLSGNRNIQSYGRAIHHTWCAKFLFKFFFLKKTVHRFVNTVDVVYFL